MQDTKGWSDHKISDDCSSLLKLKSSSKKMCL